MFLNKFYIILCIKDGSRYLKEQLNSLMLQEYTNWELTIIDDVSIDNSFEIAKDYSLRDKRINLKKNKKELGVIKNFLLNSFDKNGWIVFCDQDDIWDFNKLLELNRIINFHPEYKLFLHNGNYLVDGKDKLAFGAFGETVKNKQKVYMKKPELNLINLIFSNKVIGCFSCVNAEFLRKFVTFIPSINIYHDHWIALISSIYSKIYFFDYRLIIYRRHSRTNTKKNNFLIKILIRSAIIISLLINHINIVLGKSFKSNKNFYK